MEIRLLGTLHVTFDGAEVTPRGRSERELLAVLATRPGEVISADSLIDALWGEQLPANPANALQLRVSKLRRWLNEAGRIGDAVATNPRGYSLEVGPDAVDARRFVDGVARARTLVAEGTLEPALDRYRRAAAEWAGPALADFVDTEWARADINHLEALRLVTSEERLTLELAAGRHTEVLEEIEVLAREHPLRERLHGLRMQALYRSGRQADALAAYHEARQVLDEELGLEPGPELRELEAAILRHDAALAAPARHGAPPPAASAASAPVAEGARVPGFVGRAEELDVLLAAVSRAAQGEPQVVLLSGDAGIGKSTLLQQLLGTSRVRGFVGRSVQVGAESLPLAPAADLLRSVARAEGGPDLLSDPFVVPLRAVSPSLFPIDDPPSATPSSAQVFEAALVLLGRLSQDEPAVVAIEDLHWADSSTWELFAFLARCLSYERVLLVGTLRGIDAGLTADRRRLVAELRRMPQTTHVHLSGLTDDEVRAQLEALLGEELPAEAVAELAVRSSGNPFFVEQLARNGRTNEPVPSLLSDLLVGDLDVLPEQTNRALGMVAVCGGRVRQPLLHGMLGMADADLDAVLRPALDTRILTVESSDDTYCFRHALLAEVVDSRLLPFERARFHRRAAETIEQQPELAGGSAGGPETALALHWEGAGETVRALHASVSAAQATRAVAPDTARRHLDSALRLNAKASAHGLDAPALTQLLWDAAEAASLVGDGPAAVRHAQDAIRLEGVEPGPARAERLARYLWTAGDVPASIDAYQRALSGLTDDTPPLEAAAVHAGVAQGEYLFRSFAGAADHADAALSLLERAEPGSDRDHLEVRARSVLGAALSVLGDADGGAEHARTAVQMAMRSQDTERFVTHVYLAEALSVAGRDSEALLDLTVAVEECSRLGLDRSFGGYNLAMAAESLMRLGRWSEAATLLAGFTARDAVPVTHLRLLGAETWLAVRLGELDRAELLLSMIDRDRADAHHGDLGDRLRVECLLARGEFDEACAIIRTAWAECPHDDRRMPGRYAWLMARAALGAASAGRAAAAADAAGIIDQAVDTVEAVDIRCRHPRTGTCSPEVEAYVADARARLVSARGPGGAAADAWRTAATTWERMGMVWHQASALAWEGAEARASGASARAERCRRVVAQLCEEHRWPALLDGGPPAQWPPADRRALAGSGDTADV